MKRYYERIDQVTGAKYEAVVSIEASAITVSKRKVGTRESGSPIHIPLKHCRDNSVSAEASARTVELVNEGFVFVKESQPDFLDDSPHKYLWLIVEATMAAEAIRHLQSIETPPGVIINPFPNGVALTDTHGRSFRIEQETKVTQGIPTEAPLALVAMVLFSKAIAKLSMDDANKKTIPCTIGILHGLTAKMSSDMRAYAEANGIVSSGVLTSTKEEYSAVLI